MTKQVTRVIYKPNAKTPHEYALIVNPEEYKKWKDGDRTVPLVEVVDSFSIFYSTQGSQGFLGAPSKQQLDADFGTTNDNTIVETILESGKEQTGNAINPAPHLSMNPTRGAGGNVDAGRTGRV